jgi:hypothetical protein
MSRHLDATCFQPASEWPGPGGSSVPACGARPGEQVTFAREATDCTACLVRLDEALAAGSVRLVARPSLGRLKTRGLEHEVLPAGAEQAS